MQRAEVLFRFRTADLDGSGVVDAIDAVYVASAVGTPSPEADLDFNGVVDASDFHAVFGDINDPDPDNASTWEYIRLSLIDPLLYNDGYMMIPLLVGYTNTLLLMDDPPDHPCTAEYEAARQAALDYADALSNVPLWDPWNLPAWRIDVAIARANWKAAEQVLQQCLTNNDLPPWKPGDPLVPPPLPPPPPGGGDGCPLDNSLPPPTPTNPDVDPCFNQLQTNFLLCITCRSAGISSEPYGECLQRTRDIHAACIGDVVNE